MNVLQLAATSLLLSSSAALANEPLPTVEVNAASNEENNGYAVSISCKAPVKPSSSEVAQVLSTTTQEQVRLLTPKLMRAASEGCAAGIPKIVVTRSSNGRSLTWVAAE